MEPAAYLCVAFALFALGLCVVLARRSRLHVLMGLELMLVAGALPFVGSSSGDGSVLALFVVVVAAAQAAVGLALALHSSPRCG